MRFLLLVPMLALVGCAANGLPAAKAPRETSSLKRQEAPAYDPGIKYSKAWCQNRFVEHQKGASPGGAETVEVKRAHDQRCSEVIGGKS